MACVLSTDIQPLVHDVYAHSSKTWQYVVADPSTRHCLLIDPVMDPGNSQLSGKPADDVLAVVCRHGYRVDIIVETHASPLESRSGAWYLRMQLSDIQGFAPRVVSGNSVSGVEKLFMRKYGTSLQTNLDSDFKDGEQIEVGRMSMKVLHLPGICTPEGRGYQIGLNLFGGHSIANLKNRMRQEDFSRQIQNMSEDDCHGLWVSFQKILGLSPDYRIYFDRGEPELPTAPRVKFDDGRNYRPAEWRRGMIRTSYTTVAQCRNSSYPIDVTAAEFMSAWEGSRRHQHSYSVPTVEPDPPRPRTAGNPDPPRPRTAGNPDIPKRRTASKSAKDDTVVVRKKPSLIGSLFGRSSKG